MAKFNDWVTDMYLEFEDERMKGKCDVGYLFGDTITLCYDKKNNKTGIAKRHPNDKDDFRIGKAIAYARCKGYDVPKQAVCKKFSEMKYGDTFKVSTGRKFTFIGKNPKLTDMVILMDNLTYNVFNEIERGHEYEMVD